MTGATIKQDHTAQLVEMLSALQQRAERAEAERDALALDAARYRRLRDAAPPAQPAPLPLDAVLRAIDAVASEAARRGEMYPQTSEEQREDRLAVRRVVEMLTWYEQNTGCARIKGWPSTTAPAQPAPDPAMEVLRELAAERRRQIETEGWTPDHDDEHDAGEIAAAASAYALAAADKLHPLSQGDGDFQCDPPMMWLWDRKWWKPADPRRMLVKAGALVLAEIERIDRALLDKGTAKDHNHDN